MSGQKAESIQWPQVTGCAGRMGVYPGIGRSTPARARRTMALAGRQCAGNRTYLLGEQTLDGGVDIFVSRERFKGGVRERSANFF